MLTALTGLVLAALLLAGLVLPALLLLAGPALAALLRVALALLVAPRIILLVRHRDVLHRFAGFGLGVDPAPDTATAETGEGSADRQAFSEQGVELAGKIAGNLRRKRSDPAATGGCRRHTGL
ncbi:MAG TPA: hypothetical protein VEK75_04055 [Xanthobacteraceae bacterium]|nr:hypothetical protein [Xanthobacteraceae bacterium]